RLVAGGVHVLEHFGLVHRHSVLVGQQGRDRRGAAAEVVLLAHRGAKARLLQTGHRHRVAAAMRHAQLHRPGERGHQRHRQRQQRHKHRRTAHGQGPLPKRTLTAAPFWMSTFDPLFWMTVVRPAALAKAPPSILLSPATTWLAVLPLTVPWLSTSTVTWLSPPRSVDSASSATAWPNASTAAVGASPATVRIPSDNGGCPASADSGTSSRPVNTLRTVLFASMDSTSLPGPSQPRHALDDQ